MDSKELMSILEGKLKEYDERIKALEKEQRLIREDILSENTKERMQKRILEKPPENKEKIKERLDKEIKIEI